MKKILILLFIPALAFGQLNITKNNITVKDTLTLTGAVITGGLDQITDTTINLLESVSSNYYDVGISPFDLAIDYYAEESTGTYYFGGGQSLSGLYYYGDSTGTWQFNLTTQKNTANAFQLGADNSISSFDLNFDQREDFRSYTIRHQKVGDNTTLAKIELDEDFFEITLKNASVFNIDSFGSVTFDTLKGPTRQEAVDDVLYPSHGWSRFADSTEVLDLTLDAWQIVTNSFDSLFRGVHLRDIGLSGDTLILNDHAHYTFNYQINVAANAVNEIYEFRIMLDGVEISKMTLSTGAATDRYIIPMVAGVSADQNDRLWVEVRNIDSSNDITIYSGNWYIIYIHSLD